MWLINVEDYRLEEFHDEAQVSYAILSHRWEAEEVSFQLVKTCTNTVTRNAMKGWYKIHKCCEQAARDGLQYAWVDTCCIDKSSSAELQEAINSMWRWYAGARKCYAFLSDVLMEQPWSPKNWHELETAKKQFCGSQWFTRGWTLQELLAPNVVEFYDSNWMYLGERKRHAGLVSEAAGIPEHILADNFKVGYACVAEVMSWASHRSTTRVEDRAYSLLGLFDVNMPLLYGEGSKAFIRLQEQILRQTNDQSILAWNRAADDLWQPAKPFATSPWQFSKLPEGFRYLPTRDFSRRKATTVSSEGVSIEVHLKCIAPRLYLALLNAKLYLPDDKIALIGIYVKRLSSHQERYATFLDGQSQSGFHIATGLDYESSISMVYDEVDRQMLTLANIVNSYESRHLKESDVAAFSISSNEFEFEKKLSSFTKNARYHAEVEFVPFQSQLSPVIDSQANKSSSESVHSIHATDTNHSDSSSTMVAMNIGVGSYAEHDVFCRWPSSSVGLIKFQPRRKCFLPRLVWARGAIAFGFDGDFNPILILSLQKYRQQDWNLFGQLIDFQSGYRKDSGKMPGVQRLDICEYGRWRSFGDNKLFAFKTDTGARDNSIGFRVRLRPSRLPGTIKLEVSRMRPSDPWLLYVEFGNDHGPFS